VTVLKVAMIDFVGTVTGLHPKPKKKTSQPSTRIPQVPCQEVTEATGPGIKRIKRREKCEGSDPIDQIQTPPTQLGWRFVCSLLVAPLKFSLYPYSPSKVLSFFL